MFYLHIESEYIIKKDLHATFHSSFTESDWPVLVTAQQSLSPRKRDI